MSIKKGHLGSNEVRDMMDGWMDLHLIDKIKSASP